MRTGWSSLAAAAQVARTDQTIVNLRKVADTAAAKSLGFGTVVSSRIVGSTSTIVADNTVDRLQWQGSRPH